MSGFPGSRRAHQRVTAACLLRAQRMTAVVLLALLGLFFTAAPASGQTEPPSPETPASARRKLSFTHLTVEHGLSDTLMAGVLQDRAGFMWFGSRNGVNRYDGYAVRVFRYDSGDPHSVSDNGIRELFEDRAGTLWVGTERGLNAYDPATERFTRYQHEPGNPGSLSDNTVSAIAEDRAGVLWVGTSGGGLNRLDRATGTFTAYRHDPQDPTSLSDDRVFAIEEDRTGTLWVATYGGGLTRFDPATETFVAYRHNPPDPRSVSSDILQTIYEDRSGVLWVGTWGGGLNRFDPASGSFTTYRHNPADPASLADDRVLSLAEDDAGALWVGTFAGVSILDQGSGRIATFRHDETDSESLSNNRVADIFRDRNGLIWLATTGGGVEIYNPQQQAFTTYQHDPNNPNSLASNWITSLYEDLDGSLWVGTADRGLDRLDRRTGTVTHYPPDPSTPGQLGHPSVFAIHRDRAGVLWVATYGGGLYRQDPDSGAFTAYRHDPQDPTSISHDTLTSIAEDSSGALWIGTNGGGVNRMDPRTGTFTAYRHDPADEHSLSGNYINAIAIDDAGMVWLAAMEEGASRLDPTTGQVTRFRHDGQNPASLSHDYVFSVKRDRAGAVLFCTWGGALDQYDPESGGFIHHNPAGLADDNLAAVLEVPGGAGTAPAPLWITRNRTLVRLDRAGDTAQVVDPTDGLPRYQASRAATVSAGGELLLGTQNSGVIIVDPAGIKPDPVAPPVVLTDLLLANKSVPTGGTSPLRQAINSTDALELSYADRVITFGFAGLNHRAPEKTRYRYILENFDTDWTEVDSTRRLATYTNLDPGQYVFRVTAANGDGVWNEAGRAIAITIVPPWWQTIWFRTLLFSSLVGLAAAGYWRRMAHLRAQKHRLEQLVAERTDELAQANVRLAHEIVEHEQTEAEVRQARDELATLLASSQSIVSMLDLEPLLDRVLEQLLRLIDYDAAFVATLDGETLTIRVFRSRVPRRDLRATRLDVTRIPPMRELIASRRPFVIGDLQLDLAMLRYVESVVQERVPNHAWMGVPLVVQDRVIGVMNLLHEQANFYSAPDLQKVQAFANQVALALENARLYERSREAATLEERNRLARDLHDAVTQTLFSASLVAEALPRAWSGAPPIAVRGVEQVRLLTRGALAEMRTLLLELRPAALTEKPLSELLKALCTATSSRSQVPVDCEINDSYPLPPQVQIALYRIAQEALNNVVKHADASRVRLTLLCRPEAVVLAVADDGRGYQSGQVAPDSFGLGIMRERAEAAGARLRSRSCPGKGTIVVVRWRPPCDPAHAAAGQQEPAAAAHAAH